jgi:hypothetical protein
MSSCFSFRERRMARIGEGGIAPADIERLRGTKRYLQQFAGASAWPHSRHYQVLDALPAST